MKNYPCTIDGLIECLTYVKNKCENGGNIQIQVNVFNQPYTTGLTSICLDNDMGNSADNALLLIETDTEGAMCPANFNFYTQGKDI